MSELLICACGTPRDNPIHSVSTEFSKSHPFRLPVSTSSAEPERELKWICREVDNCYMIEEDHGCAQRRVGFIDSEEDAAAIVHAHNTRAAPTAVPAAQWQPIASAPKDGTPVILWWSHWNTAQGILGSFNPHNRGGQWEAPEVKYHSGPPPTHWMKLPEPPQGQ